MQNNATFNLDWPFEFESAKSWFDEAMSMWDKAQDIQTN